MNKTLHIISFDVPFPANYGGVIDVFYRIKALHACGVYIILHCFQYGNRGEAKELEALCEKVYYYPRKKWSLHLSLPYIVGTRSNDGLLGNLLRDDFPILFEATHCTFLINHPALSSKNKLIRMHNIEHDYYALLAASEKNVLLKGYYNLEAKLLKIYEKKLFAAQHILAISPKDESDLKPVFGEKVHLIPAFHGNEQIEIDLGRSDFCFYHGKLSVAENNLAALFLVKEVFATLPYKLVIAGDGASKELKSEVAKYKHIELIESIQPTQITSLIKQAHINVLPTFQATGIKLKLVNVLYNGRFVLVNSPMVSQTGLAEATVIADTPIEMQEKIADLYQQEFTETALLKRKTVLSGKFDNRGNAQKIIALLG